MSCLQVASTASRRRRRCRQRVYASRERAASLRSTQVKDAMVKHEQWVWKPPRSMIKSAEASGADKSKLESSAVLRKVQRDFRMMTLDRPGEKPMHLQAWPSVLKKERKHAQMMAELLGKEVAPEKQLEEMRRKMRCDLGVPSCRGAFTPSTRLVSIRRGRGWFLFRV